MMSRVVIAVVLVAIAVLIAWLVQRRRPQPTRAPTFHVPDALDRREFDRPDAGWLVVVFTSATCDTCASVIDKARALESDAVAVQEVEARAQKAVHDRYGVDAVPLVVLVDSAGVVRTHFFGPVSAADLWSALAALRDD
jgi:lipopolysaccharide export system protein LptC